MFFHLSKLLFSGFLLLKVNFIRVQNTLTKLLEVCTRLVNLLHVSFLLYHVISSNRVKDSPVTLALVISIVALYLVLLGFCVRADKHDKKKLGVVYLTENVASGICHR